MSENAQYIGLIILAAGSSRRLGTPKQLLKYRGKSLLRRAVNVALNSHCRPIFTVLPTKSEAIKDELRGMPVAIVENPHYKEGMSTSIRVGLAAFEQSCIQKNRAVVFMVCDQPLVTRSHIDELCETYLRTGKLIIASMYAKAPGVPALFSHELFPALSRLRGDRGAKCIIAQCGDVACVSFPKGAVDIDTREDYLRLSEN